MLEVSSDSEDDCYNNVASKLRTLIDKYQEDNLDSTKLLNESGELDKLVYSVTAVEKHTNENENENAESNNILDDIIKQHNKSISTRRRTRASVRKSAENTVEDITPAVTATICSVSTADPTSSGPTGRGRVRGRGRRGRRIANVQSPRGNRGGRNRNSHYNNSISSGPVYSVGNTDEYPDMSDNVQLFSAAKPNNDGVIVIDVNESLEENEEMSVKVYWQNSEFVKFVVRKYQKIAQIFDFFVQRENVSPDNLLFTYNDKILKPEDTPDSIGYRIAKFIDGGVISQNVTMLTSKDNLSKTSSKNSIKIKFQCQNIKKPVELSIDLDEKFSLSMMKCSETIEKPLDKLKFEFDGDSISGKSTPRDLDFEGGECIDVKILS